MSETGIVALISVAVTLVIGLVGQWVSIRTQGRNSNVNAEIEFRDDILQRMNSVEERLEKANIELALMRKLYYEQLFETERLKADRTILRSKVNNLEERLSMTPTTWNE